MPDHPLEPLVLDQADARARGRAHGEHWRDSVRAMAEIGVEHAVACGAFESRGDVLSSAVECLRQVEAHHPTLAEEMRGIAEGAGLDASSVAVLNLFPEYCTVGGPWEGSTIIYFNSERGPLLGVTWALPPAVEPHVRMLRIAPVGSDDELLCLTVAGSLGAVGLSGRGVAVATAALHSLDGGAGLPWPVVVRALLCGPDAKAAPPLLSQSRLAGGRYFLVADPADYYGVEHGGQRAIVTQLGPRAAHLHTNHYFDPVLRGRERLLSGSTSHYRLNLASTLYAQQRPRDAAALWSLLHTRHDSSGSLNVEPGPQPVATCATLLVWLHEGRLRGVRGAEPRGTPIELTVGRWQGGPPPA